MIAGIALVLLCTAATPATSCENIEALKLDMVTQSSAPNQGFTATLSIPEVEGGRIQSGYVIITPDPALSPPTPTVTFGLVSGGVVQSQAGIIPVPMATGSSLFVDVIPEVGRNLGVAIANPLPVANDVTLTLRDLNGTIVSTGVAVTVGPRQQLARFVTELFSPIVIGTQFQGSLQLQSSAPYSVLGLRFSGIVFSTLTTANIGPGFIGFPPRSLAGGAFANLPAPGSVGGTGAILIPQFAMGGGWATQISLVNIGSTLLTGRVDVFDSNGNPMGAKLNGNTQSTFQYSIPAGGTFVLAPKDANDRSPF